MTPSSRFAWSVAAALLLSGPLLALGCGADEPAYYEAHGVIRDVQMDRQRVEIEHEEIPGFMDAMTMYFDVPDADLLEQMQTGQEVDFLIEFDGRRARVIDFQPVGAE